MSSGEGSGERGSTWSYEGRRSDGGDKGPLIRQAPTSKIYGSDEVQEQAVASLQALLYDKVMKKSSNEFKYLTVEGRVATLSAANISGDIKPSEAGEELKRLLDDKMDTYIHVHVTLSRCNLSNQGLVDILKSLPGHPKARLSSLSASGNTLSDEFTSWMARMASSNANEFAAVKEIDLSYNYLTAVGVGQLSKALPNLRRFDVRMNMIENTAAFQGKRAIEISPQRMEMRGNGEMRATTPENLPPTSIPPAQHPQGENKVEGNGVTSVSSIMQSFQQIAASGDAPSGSPENVSQELLKLQSSRSKLYGNTDDATRLGDNLLAAFRMADNNANAASRTGPLSTPQGLTGVFPSPPPAETQPARPQQQQRPRFSPTEVAALAQAQLSRSGHPRLNPSPQTAEHFGNFSAQQQQAATRLPKSGSSITHVPTESSRAVSEVQSLIAKLEANDKLGGGAVAATQQRQNNTALMRQLVANLSALQSSLNRGTAASHQKGSGGAMQQEQPQQQPPQQQQKQNRDEGGQTVADLLDNLKKLMDTHKAENAGSSTEQGRENGQRMTVAEMEENLFNTLKKKDQPQPQPNASPAPSSSVTNRIINVPLRVVPRSEVTKYNEKINVPEENPGKPSELVCGLDLQSTSRGYLVLYISPFPGQQHFQLGDTILAINGVGLVPKTNSDAKYIRTAFGENLFDGVLCTVLRTAEGKEQIESFRSVNVNRRLYIEGLLQATGVTWKELVNSGLANDPDVAVAEMAGRKGCQGGLLRVSAETMAPMVSLRGDRESVEQVTEQVTELITVLAKRVREERTNKTAAEQAAAELKAAVMAVAGGGAAKQESPPASTEKDDSSGKDDEQSEKNTDSEKNQKTGDASEAGDFTSAKESEDDSS